jgi:hypothetical protein
MSLMYCQHCTSQIVDTDAEPESFDNDAEICLCSWCRWRCVDEDGHYDKTRVGNLEGAP